MELTQAADTNMFAAMALAPANDLVALTKQVFDSTTCHGPFTDKSSELQNAAALACDAARVARWLVERVQTLASAECGEVFARKGV